MLLSIIKLTSILFPTYLTPFSYFASRQAPPPSPTCIRLKPRDKAVQEQAVDVLPQHPPKRRHREDELRRIAHQLRLHRLLN
jgi:hypothetical protein